MATVRRPADFDGNSFVSRLSDAGYGCDGLPPELFVTGSLPPYCASGVDPQMLLDLPAAARHAAARAATPVGVLDLIEEYATPDGAERAARDFADDPGNLAYRQRVADWAGEDSSSLLDVAAWMPGGRP